MQRAWAEVNLARLSQNIQQIIGQLGLATKLMAIVKADAYGHGAVEVSKAALAAGASTLGVAWVTEALALRSAGITEPILVLSEPVSAEALQIMVDMGLEATVYSLDFAKELDAAARRSGKTVDVHVKLDTGMGRVGATASGALALIAWLSQESTLRWKGLYTHLARADEPSAVATPQQLERFDLFKNTLVKNGLALVRHTQFIDSQTDRPILLHAANSAATRNFPQSHFDLVRVGFDMYNGALSFKTRVALVKEVDAGQALSYGGTYTTRGPSHIATLSAGYADGVDCRLGNVGRVLIGGRSYSMVGRVTMDMLLVDLGPGDPGVRRGDEAVLIGAQGREHISIEEIAAACGTIPYEIMCGIGKRVPRIYV